MLKLKLERQVKWSIYLFAMALSFRITIAWVVLIVGIILWLASKFASAQRIRNLFTAEGNLSLAENSLKNSPQAGFRIALGPLSLSIAIYSLAIAISGCGRPKATFGPLTLREVLISLETLRSIIVYFWAFDIFKSFPQYRLPAVLFMLVTAGLGGLVAAVQQIFNWHPWSHAYLQGTGFLSEPMAFSGVMQIFSLIAFGLWITSGYRCLKPPFNNGLIFLLLVLANFAGLIFASERGAWLGFACTALIASSFVSWQVFWRNLLNSAIALLSAWFFIPVLRQRLQPLLSGHFDAGLVSRIKIWRIAFEEFLKSPITGIGTTRFPHIEAASATEIGKPYLAHAHNNVLQLLATAGLIGLGSYLFVIGSAITAAYKHFAKNTTPVSTFLSFRQRGERGIAIGLLAAIISLTLAGLTEYNFGTGQVRLALWFALALLASES